MVSVPLCPTISGHGLKVQVTPLPPPEQMNGALLPPPGVSVGVASLGVSVGVALGCGDCELAMVPTGGIAGVWNGAKVAVGNDAACCTLLVPVLLLTSALLLLLVRPKLASAELAVVATNSMHTHRSSTIPSPTTPVTAARYCGFVSQRS